MIRSLLLIPICISSLHCQEAEQKPAKPTEEKKEVRIVHSPIIYAVLTKTGKVAYSTEKTGPFTDLKAVAKTIVAYRRRTKCTNGFYLRSKARITGAMLNAIMDQTGDLGCPMYPLGCWDPTGKVDSTKLITSHKPKTQTKTPNK